MLNNKISVRKEGSGGVKALDIVTRRDAALWRLPHLCVTTKPKVDCDFLLNSLYVTFEFFVVLELFRPHYAKYITFLVSA